MGRLQFTRSINLKPCESSELKLLTFLYFLLRCRDQSTTPHFFQLQHHSRPMPREEPTAAPASPSSGRQFTSLAGRWMRYREFSWRLSYCWLQSCPLLIRSCSTALPPRKVLLFPWTTKPDNAPNSSVSIWLSILPQSCHQGGGEHAAHRWMMLLTRP